MKLIWEMWGNTVWYKGVNQGSAAIYAYFTGDCPGDYKITTFIKMHLTATGQTPSGVQGFVSAEYDDYGGNHVYGQGQTLTPYYIYKEFCIDVHTTVPGQKISLASYRPTINFGAYESGLSATAYGWLGATVN